MSAQRVPFRDEWVASSPLTPGLHNPGLLNMHVAVGHGRQPDGRGIERVTAKPGTQTPEAGNAVAAIQ